MREATGTSRARLVDRLSRALPSCFHTFVLGIYPVLVMTSANVGVEPLNLLDVARVLGIALAGTAVLLLLFRRLQGSVASGALWLSVIYVLFALYAPISGVLWGHVPLGPRGLAGGYAVLAATIATMGVRPWQRRSRTVLPLNVIAAVLLLLNLGMFIRAAALDDTDRWRPAADSLLRLPERQRAVTPERDIYYIVLDGFGRPDVLRQHFGVNLDGFIQFLGSQGFYIADQAQSNYAQTYPSLASTLNLNYLDPLALAVGDTSRDQRPLKYLIDHNALMRLAKQAGYHVVAIGADNSTTRSLPIADECWCVADGPGEYEMTIVNSTPLAALPFDAWASRSHRTKVRRAFSDTERASQLRGPKFVFVHILAPHPPFLFGPHGEDRAPVFGFRFNDGRDFLGTRSQYQAGYRDQVDFLVGQVTALVLALRSRPGPEPVIVVHADHGPASLLVGDPPGKTPMQERMSIFAAYALPGDGAAPVYPTMSQVNGARILANRYLGTDLPQLQDRGLYARSDQLYEGIPVEPSREAPP